MYDSKELDPAAIAADGERTSRVRQLPGYKIIVAGSRHIRTKLAVKLLTEHWDSMCKAIKARPDFVISGGQRSQDDGVWYGVDYAGERVARALTRHEAIVFPANWNRFGKAAGPLRNLDMASVAHALFVIWDGKSRGSGHMLGCMVARKRPVYEIEIEFTNKR
jgi:hypothetical protein